MFHICLVLQADPALARETCRGLESSGLKAYHVQSLAAGMSIMAQWSFDVVLMDADGFGARVPDILSELHKTRLPILVMVSDADEPLQIRMLEAGATELAPKPSALRLTALRLRKLADIQRQKPPDVPAEVRLGPLVLDTKRAAASVGGMPLELTNRQFDLLLLLTVRRGEFVHRESIAATLRQRGAEASRSTDMIICRIRRKLRESGEDRLTINTVHGRGYCLLFTETSPAEAMPLAW